MPFIRRMLFIRVDCCGDALRLGPTERRMGLSPGGVFGCCCLRLTQTVRPTHHFGYGLSASLSASDSRDVQPFTYVQSSGASLGRPRLEAGRLWPLSQELHTKPLPAMRVLVGTPEHHRAYLSWYSISNPFLVALSQVGCMRGWRVHYECKTPAWPYAAFVFAASVYQPRTSMNYPNPGTSAR